MAKHDLIFDPPIMNAAGILGFYPDQHAPIDWGHYGAFVTNPISLAPRTPARGIRYLAYPGGFMLHTGHPNPGITQAVRRYSRNWNYSPLPVIVHILARIPEEVLEAVRRLESVEGVVGVEVGVDSDANPAMVVALAQAAAGELPVILRLPMERSHELASDAIHAGAMAVSLAPPRGLYPTQEGEFTQGRLFGPAILPEALKVVQGLVKLGIPTIGAGGIYRMEQIKAMLSVGAMAVQLDSVLWRGAGYTRIE